MISTVEMITIKNNYNEHEWKLLSALMYESIETLWAKCNLNCNACKHRTLCKDLCRAYIHADMKGFSEEYERKD